MQIFVYVVRGRIKHSVLARRGQIESAAKVSGNFFLTKPADKSCYKKFQRDVLLYIQNSCSLVQSANPAPDACIISGVHSSQRVTARRMGRA